MVMDKFALKLDLVGPPCSIGPQLLEDLADPAVDKFALKLDLVGPPCSIGPRLLEDLVLV